MNREVNLQDFKPSLDELRALIKKMEQPKVVKSLWTEQDEIEFKNSEITQENYDERD